MDAKTLARMSAVIFVAIAMTAMAIEMARPPETPTSTPVLARPAETARDPLREGQRRCQQLGEAAARNDECLLVWAETRSRFFGQTSTRPALRSEEGR